MPPQKRKCASCRYFQSNQLSSKNGWCTHPSRQTSSDVRILVRTDELACRNSWGSDLWVSANGEQPAAPPEPADTSDPAQAPIPLQRRDDKVTSVVHRDSAGRLEFPSGSVVERDDIMVGEASLLPELRSLPEDESGDTNPAAAADQALRAHVLARGGTFSAIQNARERMQARRAPQTASAEADTTGTDKTSSGEEIDPDTTPAVPTPANEAPADIAESVTPVESPIRSATPRAYGRPSRLTTEPVEDSPANVTSDEQDPYNSIPARDHSIELPLAQADTSHEGPAQVGDEASDAGDTDSITVYDAVLERARAIREATGREIPVLRDEVAAEKRSRRRIQTIPEQVHAVPEPSRPAPAVERPLAAQHQHEPGTTHHQSAPADRQPQRTQLPVVTTAKIAPSRMGIPLSDLKRHVTPEQPTTQRTPTSAPPARIDFRRADPAVPAADDDARWVEPASGTVDDRLPGDDEPIDTQAARQSGGAWQQETVPPVDLVDDGYDPVEEPLSAGRWRPFGRLANPWKRDRASIEGRQTMANVRQALSQSDESWQTEDEGEFPDDDAILIQDHAAPVPVVEDGPRESMSDVDNNNVAPRIPDRQARRERSAQPSAIPQEQPRQSMPSRSHGLYRPVHEIAIQRDEADAPPEAAPVPATQAPIRRRQSGNGATVLRVRADAESSLADPIAFDGEQEQDRYSPVWDEPIPTDRYRDGDMDLRHDLPWQDEPIPEQPAPLLQEVEPFASVQVAERSWSFSPPVDLDTTEGMDSFRGRLFGTGSPSRGERQPGDDLVMDVPPQAEVSLGAIRPPLPARDSPLRSANYRGDGTAPSRSDDADRRSQQQVRPKRRRPDSGMRSEQAVYREDLPAAPDRGNRTGLDDPAFDLRAILDGTMPEPDMRVAIAPDVPRMCRTCRDFRPSESGERGFCANSWAFSHRQMVNADSLPCQSSIGCWWLPSDTIWMPDAPTPDPAEVVMERQRRSG